MRDITYCSQTMCAHLNCLRHQYHAPSGDISIADLNDGLCFDPMVFLPDDEEPTKSSDRERLLAAICRGTQNTNYKCDDVCRAMCDNDGGCAYCSAIAGVIEEEFGGAYA
jgi:hypothetical protein